jgi:Domain of unknown function (DUF397)
MHAVIAIGKRGTMENPPSAQDQPRSTWRRSSACVPRDQCVELRSHPGHVHVRDSKGREAAELRFPWQSWRGFSRALATESDLADAAGLS